MGFFDKAKQFLGGKNMASVEITVIERQPAATASFPVGDSVLKGTMVITAQQACTLLDAGMAVLLAARLITGRSLATPIPFAVVCVAELANEILDRINNGSWLWLDTGLDVVNTLVWPLVLMIGLRVRRSREGRSQPTVPAHENGLT